MKSINVYDFDHTIYRGDASVHFIKYCLSHKPGLIRYLPGQAIVLILFIFGLRDRKEVKQVAFKFLCSVKNLDELLDGFWKKRQNNIEAWYLKQRSDSDIIISASPEFLLKPIASKLGVHSVIATHMNKATGLIDGLNCRGEEKLRRLLEYDKSIEINMFYSDSLADMPLLKVARKPYLVRRGVIIPFAAAKGK